MEDSAAKETLLAEPEAAGAYDRVPFASASAVFTMDTSNDIFLLHSIQVRLGLTGPLRLTPKDTIPIPTMMICYQNSTVLFPLWYAKANLRHALGKIERKE